MMRYKSTKKQVHPPRFLLSPVFDAMHRWQNKCAFQWADSCSASRCHFQSPRCSVTNAGAPGGLNGGGYISIIIYQLKGYAFAFEKYFQDRNKYIYSRFDISSQQEPSIGFPAFLEFIAGKGSPLIPNVG